MKRNPLKNMQIAEFNKNPIFDHLKKNMNELLKKYFVERNILNPSSIEFLRVWMNKEKIQKKKISV